MDSGKLPRGKQRALWSILGAWCIVALAWAGLLAFLNATDTRTGNLLRDAVEVGRVSALSGFFSTLGVMGWAMAAGASFMAGWVLHLRGDRRATIYPLATGLLAIVLGIDDALLVHEVLAPRRLKIPENAVLVAYGVLAGAWLFAFRARWDRVAWLLLGLAAACFLASFVMDVVVSSRILYEDGFKYLALWTFVAFCLREAARCVAFESPHCPPARGSARSLGPPKHNESAPDPH